jgi:hypothetical protein
MSSILNIGESQISGEGGKQAGEIAQFTHIFNARIDDINADFVKATTKQNIASAKRQADREISAQRAAIGASGLTAESFDAVTQESAMEVERDILAIELQSEVEQFNLRQSAQIERAAGEAAKFGATVASNAARARTTASVVRGAAEIASFF